MHIACKNLAQNRKKLAEFGQNFSWPRPDPDRSGRADTLERRFVVAVFIYICKNGTETLSTDPEREVRGCVCVSVARVSNVHRMRATLGVVRRWLASPRGVFVFFV